MKGADFIFLLETSMACTYRNQGSSWRAQAIFTPIRTNVKILCSLSGILTTNHWGQLRNRQCIIPRVAALIGLLRPGFRISSDFQRQSLARHSAH